MSLGEVIRKYRKTEGMTQEEMAERLGVTASAVNKWERGNSYPDITLLAPIARLLHISLDTLLSFRGELTKKEVGEILKEAQRRLEETEYGDAFSWAKRQINQYPDCEVLILQLALCFDAYRVVHEVTDAEAYDRYFCGVYERLLESGEERIRMQAADALVGFYRRKKDYPQAEKYLEYFSMQNPERKRNQAQIYGETGRIQEAYRTYEELLFSDYQRISAELYGMYQLALKEKDLEMAHRLVSKQAELARCFEMGRYYEVSTGLELATMEKDTEQVLALMREMLSSVEEIGDFRNAWLYRHMEFRKMEEGVAAEMKEKLLQCFRDEETYGFLKENKEWRELGKGDPSF
ncbi:helix-turn-helix transcriptional regulator [Anaerotignum lactatifermentans]|uniref:Helix-turn-helix transcriptional regulator n=1 Tax=Anaerotignum lactatifermentans TaxID=160404 RepID=A0ABS2G8M0_9FIRM|nr:helix-turn-helix transcriptional regulator [Anaerotignum lactatifermentans]MBM6828733.1 helix-turn-helix transcriptional regulator [Anaerotignum lactatifermentans]MBM6877060.1 helix-turn-helix transcriptional regulator [Anaerotignum lactatifermentans]MBM6950315.1 helix-turn-helix transcriptional regulator [Anaerotignum lactatifermentans]